MLQHLYGVAPFESFNKRVTSLFISCHPRMILMIYYSIIQIDIFIYVRNIKLKHGLSLSTCLVVMKKRGALWLESDPMSL